MQLTSYSTPKFKYVEKPVLLPYQAENVSLFPRILLVEDQPLLQRINKNLLDTLGCNVEIAADGTQALAMYKNGYDLIFMDIELPDMSGIEVTLAIREYEKMMAPYFSVPIVALTSLSNDIEVQCMNAGMNGFATKPIRKEKLQEILVQYVMP